MKAVAMTVSQQEMEDRRANPRLRLQLKLAVVYHQRDDRDARPTYHGITHDICMSGLSMIVDQNIFHDGEVTVLLALPSEHPGAPQKIVTSIAEMTYAIHSSRLNAFKIGVTFREFRSNGKELLEAVLLRQLKGIGAIGTENPSSRYSADRPSDSQPLRW
jgi:hypothetical protein